MILPGFVIGDAHIAASDVILGDGPAAEAPFQRVHLSLEDGSAMTACITEGPYGNEAIRAMGQALVQANREEVDDWLRAARDAAP